MKSNTMMQKSTATQMRAIAARLYETGDAQTATALNDSADFIDKSIAALYEVWDSRKIPLTIDVDGETRTVEVIRSACAYAVVDHEICTLEGREYSDGLDPEMIDKYLSENFEVFSFPGKTYYARKA